EGTMRTITRARPLLAAVLLLVAGAAGAQTGAPTPESELNELTFPPLKIEPEILNFPDSDFSRIGLKIQLRTASLQERRWGYRTAERLAPSRNPPPADWRMKAAQAAAALDPGTAASGSTSSPIYRWASVGPNGNYDVSGIDGPSGNAADQGRATAIWTDLRG